MKRHLCLLLSLFLLAPLCTAQLLNDGSATGLPPFVSMHGGQVDLVSLQNGNLHIEIPLVTVRNKRGRTTTYRYVYDTPTWVLTRYPGPGLDEYYWVVDQAWDWTRSEGWRIAGDSYPYYVVPVESTITCPVWTWPNGYTDMEVTVKSNWTVNEHNGTKHPLALRLDSAAGIAPCSNQQFTSYALDGSGIFVDISGGYNNPSIWEKDGTQTSPSWHDTNGNLGVVLPSAPTIEYFYNANPMYEIIHFKNSNGSDLQFKLTWPSSSVAGTTNLCPLLGSRGGSWPCYESDVSTGGMPGTLSLLSNGSPVFTYTFSWGLSAGNQVTLASVGLPTGGSISYTYEPHIYWPEDWRGAPENVRASVTSRTVTANGSNAIWTYSGYRTGFTGSGGTTTVTRPDGVQELHTFDTLAGLGTSVETQVQIKQNGTTLRTVTTDYAWNTDPETSHAISQRPIRETVTLENGLVTKTETDYETGTANYGPGYTYTFTRLNPTEKREYDYGSGAAGGLLRRATFSYLHSSNSNYLNLHITDRLSTRNTYDGSGNLAAASQTLYDTTTVSSAGGAVQHDYTNFGTNFTIRGNPTSVQSWRNTDSTWLATTNTFDELGNLRQSQDPGGHNTTFDYTDSWGNGTCAPTGGTAQIWATSSTNHLGHIIRQTRNSCTSTLATATDPNSQVTTYTYDSINRLSQISLPGGGQTTYTYSDVQPLSMTETQLAGTTSTTRFDDLGRIYQSELVDPEGDVFTDTTYDAFGRVRSISNPHRAAISSTDGATYTDYDALGRAVKTTHTDAAHVYPNGDHADFSYSGNTTTVTDETGRPRKSCSDALGRLTSVVEPNPTTWSLTTGAFPTYYTYDALGNLLSVNQQGDGSGARNRSFTYDSLSRLLTADNPESGTVMYTYTADATCNPAGESLRTKTDARGVTTTYCYEPLHRLTGITYPAGTPTVSYTYDSIPGGWGISGTNLVGRRTTAQVASSPTIQTFSYDPMGRIVNQWNCLPSSCGVAPNRVTAGYDYAGHVTSLTYPSGRVVSNRFTTAAARLDRVRFETFSGQSVGYDYVNVPTGSATDPNTWGYYPHGAFRESLYGSGVADLTSYNPRLQLSGAETWSPVGTRLQSHSPNWLDASGKNNGNVWGIADNLSSDQTQNFSYDGLNRLTAAWASGNIWGNSFQMDAWGNLNKMQAYQNKPLGQWLDATTDTKNRFVGFSYDDAGNMLANGSTNYQYDAESRIKSVNSTGATYTYDADGNRVRKDVGSDATEYIYFGGQVIAEHKPNGDWSDYIYANGKRIAKADNFENGVLIQGHNDCSACGANTWYRLNDGQSVSGYTIRTGDKLVLRQYQENARGGVGVFFRDGTHNVWSSKDQANNYTNDLPTNGSWVGRAIDLVGYENRVIDWIGLDNDGNAPFGNWAIVYSDIALVSTDGTVQAIYNGSLTPSLSLIWSGGVSQLSSGERHLQGANVAETPAVSTVYYHGDHLGTSRLMTNYFGYPVWQGTFLPYGYEWNPQTTTNHYKFTGKERDSETGLDYFGARYYGSNMGRFTTPDEPFADQDEEDPQSWNLYGYVRNNPLRLVDPDGRGAWDVAKGFVEGTANFVANTVKGVAYAAYAASPIGAITGANQKLAAATTDYVATGAGAYQENWGTAVVEGVLAQGEQGAVAITTEAVLTGGLAASSRVNSIMPEGASSGVAANAAKGAASEARVLNDIGATKNTKSVVGSEGKSIPDFQNTKVVGEIKDAKSVSNTRQLRIQKEAAQQSGRQHQLISGTNTRVTNNAAQGTKVIRRDDLGPE